MAINSRKPINLPLKSVAQQFEEQQRLHDYAESVGLKFDHETRLFHTPSAPVTRTHEELLMHMERDITLGRYTPEYDEDEDIVERSVVREVLSRPHVYNGLSLEVQPGLTLQIKSQTPFGISYSGLR